MPPGRTCSRVIGSAASLRVAAPSSKAWSAREKKADQIGEQLKTLKKTAGDLRTRIRILLAKDAAKARGEAIGNILVTLMVPAVRKVQQAADRIEQLQANVHVAFAVA